MSPPPPEFVETQSLEETSSTEPTCEQSDPAIQVAWQTDQNHNSNTQPDFDMGGIKKTLVIKLTHPSNTGEYYCATADDVAQLIVENQGDIFCEHFSTNSLCSFSLLLLQCRANICDNIT